MVKIAAGIITFNSDFFLKELLTTLYDRVDQILIAEGPVKWWADTLGVSTSTDKTPDILSDFAEMDYNLFVNKVTYMQGPYKEKKEQANAYMPHLWDDIDYIINNDSDEFYTKKDWNKILDILDSKKYTEIQFKSNSFFGGFDHIIGGFEKNARFVRIQKVYPGCRWKSHRPPRIKPIVSPNVLTHDDTERMGIRIQHYSYVFPRQVQEKLEYYKKSLNPGNCIENYFENVYIPWVLGNNKDRERIEHKYRGVQEFIRRSPAFTEPFTGEHPKIIQDNMGKLKEKFDKQLEYYKKKI